jgi:hypothetical protein
MSHVASEKDINGQSSKIINDKINQTIQLDGKSEMLPLHFCPWPRLIGSCFLSQSLWLAVSLEMLEEMVGDWQKTEVGNAQGPVP